MDRSTNWHLLKHVGGLVADIVTPNRCAFCGLHLAAAVSPVCGGCLADLPWSGHACARCASPLPGSLPDGTHCATCQYEPPVFAAVVAPLQYRFPVDAAIKALKYRRKLHYAPAFAAILANAASRLPGGIDAVLPVPLHWRRQALRGFNQAAEICRRLPRTIGAPFPNTVRRVRPTSPQAGLGAGARRRNVRGAFAMNGDLRVNHVLIVDDVMTTGATCGQLAELLLARGATKVSVLAVARASTPD